MAVGPTTSGHNADDFIPDVDGKVGIGSSYTWVFEKRSAIVPASVVAQQLQRREARLLEFREDAFGIRAASANTVVDSPVTFGFFVVVIIFDKGSSIGENAAVGGICLLSPTTINLSSASAPTAWDVGLGMLRRDDKSK